MPIPKEHFTYTIDEWSKIPFTQIMDALSDIKVAYDIGANVGGFSEILKRKFPDVKLYCFEPCADNFTELKYNTPYATHIHKGVYYGKKEGKLIWRGSNEGAIFLEHVDTAEPRIERGEIAELVELEDLNFEKPDLIKMDVEGAEENIIEYSTLLKNTPSLIIEWHLKKDPFVFFEKHLPDHRVAVNLSNQQFLLCLKSQ